MGRPVAIVYIDGFNLYRRCLEHYPELKWLDLLRFAENLLPYCEIRTVHYFTARIRPGTSLDQRGPQRQQAYLRALDTLAPAVRTHLGQFRVDRREMVAHPGTLRVVAGDAGAVTGLILPMETARASKELMKAGPGFVGFVTRAILEASQLPDAIPDAVGTVRRPAHWS